LGDKTSITYPLGSPTWTSKHSVDYRYDDAQDMVGVFDFGSNLSAITDTADDLPNSIALGDSGDSVSTTYDQTDSPSAITLSNGSTLQSFSYKYLPSGGIDKETDV